MELVTAESADFKKIRELYEAAFPFNERKPFRLLKSLVKKSVMEAYVVKDDGFCGFMLTADDGDVTLLDYFAISGDRRGGGVGGKALSLLAQKKAGKTVVIEIESPDAECGNLSQRQSRKRFYLKNGFVDTGVRMRIFGNDMEMLCLGKEISFEQYCRVFYKTAGVIGRAFIKYELLSGEKNG